MSEVFPSIGKRSANYLQRDIFVERPCIVGVMSGRRNKCHSVDWIGLGKKNKRNLSLVSKTLIVQALGM